MNPNQLAKAKDAPLPTANQQPAPWPVCGEEEEEAVLRVLRSGKLNYWTGEEGKQFEAEFAQFVGAEHALAVANGTVGLELALAVLDIGPGDEVIVPSRTFIATASAVAMRGAKPVCADVDADSQNITVETIRPQITSRTRAIIPVHLAGWPCDMQPILELAKQHNLRVIEDCAQAHGARYCGQHVGSMGDLGVFSFCQDKIMTTGGEGGMVVTNDSSLWKNAWSLKDHGKCYDTVHHQQHPPGFRWLHKSFGTNWRMTEMQSALGRVALQKLPQWIKQRRQNAAMLHECLQEFDVLRTPTPPEEIVHSYYKFYTFVRPGKLKPDWDRDRLMQEINDQGVSCFSGSCSEIYLEGAFPEELKPAERLPMAQELGETSLMFLVHPTIASRDIRNTCQVLQSILKNVIEASRGASSRRAA